MLPFEKEAVRSEPATEKVTAERSDLDEKGWAIVPFDKLEGTDLTYEQTANIARELDAAGVAGLCIVTVEVANRIRTPE
ncbi:MAG: hypothetical protein H0V76_11950 [Blastocatellia bacterium]|nr:hypothetical protein [Blastocatellia bacterium]